MPLTITEGTQTNVYSVENAGTEIPYVKLDAGVGSAVQDWGGTIPTVTTVGNLTNGSVRMTIGTVTTGSITDLAKVYSGTINAGTFQLNSTPVTLGTPSHTRGTTGVAVWGTVKAAAGAGTKQYVSNVDIVVVSGTVDVAVTNIGIGGSTGDGVFTRGQFTPGGGISKPFVPAIASNTNGTLAFWMGGAGTADITVTYWQGV